MPIVTGRAGASGPLSPGARVDAAARVLANAGTLWVVSAEVGVSFHLACAFVQQESGGRNVYGHDPGGALSGFPLECNADNYAVFRWLVVERGELSNGVGPMQITYAGGLGADGRRSGGYFAQMEARELRPWVVADNLRFGLELVRGNLKARKGSVAEAATLYNAGNLASGVNQYGRDVAAKDAAWIRAFGL